MRRWSTSMLKPVRIIATSATAFEPALKRRMSALIDVADSVALDEVGQIEVEVGRAFAQAALTLIEECRHQRGPGGCHRQPRPDPASSNRI